MFFKRRPPPVPAAQTAPPVVESEPAPSLAARAKEVARALRAFEEQAYAEGQTAPGDDLIQAREAVAAAKTVVESGRLSYALLRQLLNDTRTWPAWIKRDDFESLKGFDCQDVVATERRVDGTTTKEIAFVFNGRPYKLVHLDKGYSHAPDADHKWGDVSFYAGDVLVLSVSATESLDDDYWKMSSVKALRVGDGAWMTDLLQIATDIETGWNRRRDKFVDDATMEAAKNIKLE